MQRFLPRSFRHPAVARWLVRAVAMLALLDLTTSAVPSFIDVFGPVPAMPVWLRVSELLCALWLVPDALALVRPARAFIAGLPGSRWGIGLMVVYLLGMSAAVATRTEHYPFSNVGMFSAVPHEVDTRSPRSEWSLVFVRDDAVSAVATLREGSAVAGSFATGWDYKTGWVMHMFGTADSHALALGDQVARERGYGYAARAIVTFDPRTGATLGVQPLPTRVPQAVQ